MEHANSSDSNSNMISKQAEDRKLPEAWLRFLEAVSQQFSDYQKDHDKTK